MAWWGEDSGRQGQIGFRRVELRTGVERKGVKVVVGWEDRVGGLGWNGEEN